MPNYDNPRGFIECRRLGGSNSPVTRRRKVKANGVAGSHQKFPGDPVVLVSGNSVAVLVNATTASLPVLGVIRAVYDSTGKPLTHSLPSGGNFIPSSTAGWVDVNEDPAQTYIVNADATVLSTYIGQYVDVTANSPNTAAGRSGYQIDISSAVNTITANAVPFQIIGLGYEALDGNFGNPDSHDVEVIMCQGAFTNANKVR